MYDVFVSHRNENKVWANTLADNLMRCGLGVCLTPLGPSCDEPVTWEQLDALQNSLHGILLATPEALESGWAQDQYDAMRAVQKTNPGFRIIILCFGALPHAPFLTEHLCVDFANPNAAAYESSFRQLLSGLHDQLHSAPMDLAVKLEIPPPPTINLAEMETRPLTPNENRFFQSVFTALDTHWAVMLLAPTDHNRPPVQRAILAEAQRRFGPTNSFHLNPLGQVDADRSAYLSYLGNQIQAGRIFNKPSDLEFLLADHLAREKHLFLFVTRVEEGSAEGRRAFSHALRNLGERYSNWLKIVLCGSEHLLDLRYKEGHLSPLHNAETLRWPSPDVDDILQWQEAEGGLSEKTAEILLRLTGGNVRLIRQALKMQQPPAPLDLVAVAKKLKQDPLLRARFAAYQENGSAERVAALLKRDDLGRYEPWPLQTTLRHLYWDGLLVEHEGRFRWRCDLIRLIGREVLGS